MDGIDNIKNLLSRPKVISIISHRNPDGDALGSSLALSLFLQKSGHATHVIMPSEFPTVFSFLQQSEKVVIFDLDQERVANLFSISDVIFCLDFNSLERIDKIKPHIDSSKAKIILIDHHLDPEHFADYMLSDDKASSTCELVYRFIDLLGQLPKLDIPIGECLLTGIITDTGSFKYGTNPEVYKIAGALKAIGVDDYSLQDAIFNSLNEKQLRLLGHSLKSRMEILDEYQTGIITLNKFDFENYDIQRGDTEGIVNYMMMNKNVKIAIFIRQQATIIKISFRSKGDISVQELARDHFNGGGHKNAAGGYMHGRLSHVVDKIKEVIPDYAPTPINT